MKAKRIISTLLLVIMLIGQIPTGAFAANEWTEETVVETTGGEESVNPREQVPEENPTDVPEENPEEIPDENPVEIPREEEIIEDETTEENPDGEEPEEEETEEVEEERTRTEYVYDDGFITVTATLTDPTAVPDNAYFTVNRIVPNSGLYNYDAYMEALNNNEALVKASANGGVATIAEDENNVLFVPVGQEEQVEETKAFDETNTVLYDVAFMLPYTDADGNIIEGAGFYEYQPEAGSVIINFVFKDNTLTNLTENQDSSEISAVHLPLVEQVKDAVDSTQAATDITAEDIVIEPVESQNIYVESVGYYTDDVVTVALDSLSVIAFTNASGTQVTTLNPGTPRDFQDILGSGSVFSILANTFEKNADIECGYACANIIIKSGDNKSARAKGGNTQSLYVIGAVDSNSTATLMMEDNILVYYDPKTDPNGLVTIQGPGTMVEVDSSVLTSFVTDLMNASKNTSNAMAGEAGTYKLIEQGTPGAPYILDISDQADGTYYFDIDNLNSTAPIRFEITKKENQTIVFTGSNSSYDISLAKLTYKEKDQNGNDILKSIPLDAVYSIDACKTIVWNFPQAIAVNLLGEFNGILLAPNATVKQSAVAAGWVIANTFVQSGCEWHDVWDGTKPAITIKLNLSKTLNGQTPNRTFEFNLEYYRNGKWEHIRTVKTDSSNKLTINVGNVPLQDYLSSAGTGDQYYRLSEINTSYYTPSIPYIIAKIPAGNTTPTYYNAAYPNECNDATNKISGTPTINNTAATTIDIEGEKKWDDNGYPLRPAAVTVKLQQQVNGSWVDYLDSNGQPMTQTVSNANNWKYSFKNLPLNSVYQVIEDPIPTSYGKTYTPQYDVVLHGEIAFTHQGNSNEKYSLRQNGQNGTVMARATAAQSGDLVVFSLNGYPYKDASGNTYTYTVWRDSDNKQVYRGFSGMNDYSEQWEVYTRSITNYLQYDPKFGTIQLTKKITGDLANHPELVGGITFDITTNGTFSKTVTLGTDFTETPTGSGIYVCTLQNMPADPNLQYTITESNTSVTNYVLTSSSNTVDSTPSTNPTQTDTFVVVADVTNDVVFTNNYRSEKTEITVNKSWSEANGNTSYRAPFDITLYADGTAVDTHNFAATDTTYTWQNLDRFKTGTTTEIQYTVAETTVPYSYDASAAVGDMDTGFTITNTLRTVTISGEKSWNDGNNQDSMRPASIDVAVRIKGTNTPVAGPVTVTQGTNGKWEYTFADLPAGDKSNPIVYECYEVNVPTGYTQDLSQVATNYNIANSHTPLTVSISGEKKWVDNNDNRGIRPSQVTIRLLADGKEIDHVDVKPDASGNWTYSFANLPMYNNGTKINYTVTEDPVNGYISNADTAFNTYDNNGNLSVTQDFTNRLEVINISGTKQWDDYNDAFSTRPASLVVNLYIKGTTTPIESVTTDSSKSWKYDFSDLAKYDKQGFEIEYIVDEAAVTGYTKTPGDKTNNYNLKNTLDTVTVKATKSWKDDTAYKNLIRPASVTFVVSDGTNTVHTFTLNDGNSWTDSVVLPKYDSTGAEIKYTVTEPTVPNGYTMTSSTGDITNGFTIENTMEKVDINGTKTWDDSSNYYKLRPAQITLRVYNVNDYTNAVASQILTVDQTNNSQSYTFTDLPKYDSTGAVITYEVKEDAVALYNPTYPGNNEVKNTLETISINGNKTWNDGNFGTFSRPNSITVEAINSETGAVVDSQTVTLQQGNTWSYSFPSLPKYYIDSTGTQKTITYEIKEKPVYGYNATVTGYDITNDLVTTTITGTKSWIDENDKYSTRPASITVILKADGNEIARTTTDASQNWQYSFSGVPMYRKADGQQIVYTVEELAVTGYTASYSGNNITNTLSTVDVKVDKTWDDNNDKYSLRPAKVQIQAIDKNTGTVYATGTVTDTLGVWTYTFQNLPEFDKTTGNKIEYTVKELPVTGYTSSAPTGDMTQGFGIENKLDTVSFKGTKNWDKDSNNQYNTRPASITVYAVDSTTNKTIDQITVTPNNGKWDFSFTGLPKYDNNGNVIVYTLSEGAVTGYNLTSVTADPTTNTFTLTNTLDVKDLSGKKTWNDASDRDRLRPTSITVRLYRDNVEVANQVVNAQAGDVWTWTFKDIPKDGVYTVTEDAVNNYSTSINNTTYEITNSYTPEETSITVTKSWDDDSDRDGVRPVSVTIKVLANGVDTGKTIVLSDANNWTDTLAKLPKNDAGKAITYTVEEDMTGLTGIYTAVIKGNAPTGFTVDNKHTPATVDIPITKTWKDNNDQDGKRPTATGIVIHLYADNVEVDKATVYPDRQGNWSYTFKDMPQYNKGKAITYTIGEDQVPSYNYPIVTAYDVENTHAIEKVSVDVQKQWDDQNNLYSTRPGSVTIVLVADGVDTTNTLTLDDNNGWKGTFKDLDKYKAGNEIKYTVKEVKIPGYTCVTTGDQQKGFTVTNTLDTVDVSGSKTWAKDNNNSWNTRPASIKVYAVISATGRAVADAKVTPDANGDWNYIFTKLPAVDSTTGNRITYTVTEDTVANYDTTVSGTNITNTLQVQDISGTKTWNDSNDQDRKRPAQIVIHLLRNGTEIASKPVTAKDNWKWTFKDVPKDGTYSITEDAVTDYTTTYSNYDVTNSYTPGKTSVSVKKVWDDDNNRDGIRPTSVDVTLFADGINTNQTLTLDANNNWQGTFTNLDINNNGIQIDYTVKEAVPTGYTESWSGTAAAGYVVTNTHNIDKVTIAGQKTWIDSNNRDGKRPTSITVRLYANGKEVDSANVTPDANGIWSWSFDVPKNDNGKAIAYTVDEDAINEYTKTVNGYNITNSYTTKKTSVDVTKVWSDNNALYGNRPDDVTVKLYADGADTGKTLKLDSTTGWQGTFTNLDMYANGNVIDYTVKEVVPNGYTASYSGTAGAGFTITNTVETVEVKGLKTWLNDSNNKYNTRPASIIVSVYNGTDKYATTTVVPVNGAWDFSFKDLPKCDKYGNVITYTVKEDSVGGYTSVVNGTHIQNTLTTIDIQGTKVWDDNSNQDGNRPSKVTINLLADGAKIDSVDVTNQGGDSWSWSFLNVPEYNSSGNKINYTVTEDTVTGYSMSVTGDATNGFTVTNKYTPGIVSVTVSKSWVDSGNKYFTRPNSVTVNLYADNVPTGQSLKLDDSNGWTATFQNLPEKNSGVPIKYTIDEVKVPGYDCVTTTQSGGYLITNTLKTTDINGTKTWTDFSNRYNIRPGKVTIRVFNGAKEVDNVVVNKNGSDVWSYSFKDLPQCDTAGNVITYTVKEDAVAGYNTKYTGYNIENTLKTVRIDGTKTWSDNNDQDGKRPSSITVNLLANGTKIDSQVVNAASGNVWKYSFTDLPELDANGAKIIYTVTENTVSGYSASIAGYDITNTYTPGLTSVTVTKNWNDSNNQYSTRPASVTVKLIADGADTGKTVVLSDANSWTDTFANLPEKSSGTLIKYTVEEVKIAGYDCVTTSQSNDFYITNTLKTVNVEGTKTWAGDTGNLTFRPNVITVYLVANGTRIDSRIVNPDANGDWKYSFMGVPQLDSAGNTITYTIEEDAVSGYTTTITGYDITNTMVTTSVNIRKQSLADGSTLANASFILETTDGSGNVITVDNWTSSTSDHSVTTIIPNKQYTLTEQTPPAGHVPLSAPVVFTVDDSGTIKIVSCGTDSNGINEAYSQQGVLIVLNNQSTVPTGEIIIKKTIKGALTEEEKKGKLTFEVKDDTGKLIGTYTIANDFTQQIDGSYVMKLTVDAGKRYIVTETVKDAQGYTLASVTNTVNGTTKTTADTDAFDVAANATVNVDYEDNYVKDTGKIVIKKTIKGALTEEEKKGALTFEVTDEKGTVIGTYTIANDFTKQADGTYIKELDVEAGKKYIVTETITSATGYTLASVTNTVNGTNKKTTADTDAFDVAANATVNVDYEDNYVKDTGKIVIKKTITGALTEEERKGKLTFEVKDDTGKPIGTYTIANDFTKQADGTYTMELTVEAGKKYIVTETIKDAQGYTLASVTNTVNGTNKKTTADTDAFTVDKDKTVNVDYADDYVKDKETGKIVIKKTIKGDLTEEERKGKLTFEVKDDTGKLIGTYTIANDFTKQADGTYIKELDVEAGKKYIVTETIKDAQGYTLASVTNTVNGTNKKTTADTDAFTVDKDKTVNVDYADDYVKDKETGKIVIKKTIKGDLTEEERKGKLTFEVKDDTGKLIGTYTIANDFTKQADGTYIKELDVEAGKKYIVTETIKDAQGYTLASVTNTVNGTTKNTADTDAFDVTANATVNVDYEDDYKAIKKEGYIKLQKTVTGPSKQDLNGFLDFEIVDENGQSYGTFNLINDFTETSPGVYTKTVTVEQGLKYTVEEKNYNVAGYTLKDQKFSIEGAVYGTGPITDQFGILDATTKTIYFEDDYDRNTFDIGIAGADITDGTKLKGATFGLYDDTGTLIKTWNSSDTAAELFAGLDFGREYTVKETKAPDKYIATDTDVVFTIDKNGQIDIKSQQPGHTDVTIENNLQVLNVLNEPTELKLAKIDSATRNKLAGAQLIVLDSSGNQVMSWTSTTKVATFGNITKNTHFFLSEVSAPSGYTRITRNIEFYLDDKGNVQLVNPDPSIVELTGNILYVKNTQIPKVSVAIQKVKSACGQPLAGAVLRVTDQQGNTIDQWTSDGTNDRIISGLTPGQTYVLTEVSAPSGFNRINNAINFVVDVNGIVTISTCGCNEAQVCGNIIKVLNTPVITPTAVIWANVNYVSPVQTSPTITPSPTPYRDPSLAATGQLNWPIPIFGGLGLAFILLGFVMTRKKQDEEKNKGEETQDN